MKRMRTGIARSAQFLPQSAPSKSGALRGREDQRGLAAGARQSCAELLLFPGSKGSCYDCSVRVWRPILRSDGCAYGWVDLHTHPLTYLGFGGIGLRRGGRLGTRRGSCLIITAGLRQSGLHNYAQPEEAKPPQRISAKRGKE